LPLPPLSSLLFADVTWTAECWQAAIQPLTKLTSLQLKLPLVLAAGEHLQLESLAGLKRLELMLDEPKTPGGAAEVRFSLDCVVAEVCMACNSTGGVMVCSNLRQGHGSMGRGAAKLYG
jgi:hypothetical protein